MSFAAGSWLYKYSNGNAQLGTLSEADPTANMQKDVSPNEQVQGEQDLAGPSKEIFFVFLKLKNEEYTYDLDFTNNDIAVLDKLAKLYNSNLDKMLLHVEPIVLPTINEICTKANYLKYKDDPLALAQMPVRKMQGKVASIHAYLFANNTMKKELRRVLSRYLELREKQLPNEAIALMLSDENKYGAISRMIAESSKDDYKKACDLASKDSGREERAILKPE